jgi:hypothetical protein
MARDLAMVLPSRNEEFLKITVEDILRNRRADTEIIVGLDGQWASPPLVQDERLSVIYYHDSIGQRAITNQCVKLTDAKYVAKFDAHCSFDEGFDEKMLQAFAEIGHEGIPTVMVPVMKNLHVYDYKCPKCGKKVYQDKEPICVEPSRHPDPVKMRKKIIWQPRKGTHATAYCFDPEPHFQYDSRWARQQIGDLVESMSLQGSGFMCSREDYWRLNICDEEFGSWGSQAIEIACKFWLSGGRVLVNKRTFYAHTFRTKPLFSFPYQLSGRQVERAKKRARALFFDGEWEGAIHPLSWLIEKFWQVPGWSDEDLRLLKESEALRLRSRAVLPSPISGADSANAAGGAIGEETNGLVEMPFGAMSLGAVDRGDSV